MIKILPIVIFFALIFSGHYLNAQGMTDEELSMQRITDRMNSLEKNMATMQQDLYKNSKNVRKQASMSDEPSANEEERARAMNGKFEEVEHHISQLANKLDKIIADIDFRLTTLEKTVSSNAAAAANTQVNNAANIPVDTGADGVTPATPQVTPPANTTAAKIDEKKPAATKSKTDATAQYEKAFEFLRLSKYDEAEKAFKDFIANNKNSALISNAYYWLGETYLSRENYQQAAVNFLKGYQDFPKGLKAPDSLFKLSVSLRSLQKVKEACATLDKLKSEYPSMDKDLLTKSTDESKGLKCKSQ